MFNTIRNFLFDSSYILTDSQTDLLTIFSCVLVFVFTIVVLNLFFKLLHIIF